MLIRQAARFRTVARPSWLLVYYAMKSNSMPVNLPHSAWEKDSAWMSSGMELKAAFWT